MGHIDANVEVLLAIGSNPGSAFNTVIRPTFREQGLGAFCITDLTIPSSLNIPDGTQATIQVVMNGDPNGGLFNCADITFSSTATNPDENVCKNATGVTVSVATVEGNPNVTSDATNSTNGVKSVASENLGAGIGSIFMVVLGVMACAMVL